MALSKQRHLKDIGSKDSKELLDNKYSRQERKKGLKGEVIVNIQREVNSELKIK